MPDNLLGEVQSLCSKEAWARDTASWIVETRGLRFEDALAGTRWACLWLDDAQDRLAGFVDPTKSELKEVIDDAYLSSLSRAEAIPRFPFSQEPVARVIIAAIDAFCSVFEDPGLILELIRNN